ncbi:hypothetical protein [Bacillus mycoides]|uniref:hypothetical protein n=1 Tax=Bacillus mycoides TaxID=1405 RepID=UPI003D0276BC
MRFWNVIGHFFKKDGETVDVEVSNRRLRVETAYKRLYVDSAIDLIACSLVGCEFLILRQ